MKAHKTTLLGKTLFVVMSFLLAFNNSVFAEGTEMADVMRENGKIYVVVAVLVVIFIGLFIYLILTDKKVSNLEKEIKK